MATLGASGLGLLVHGRLVGEGHLPVRPDDAEDLGGGAHAAQGSQEREKGKAGMRTRRHLRYSR
jgi:hypothetical protein